MSGNPIPEGMITVEEFAKRKDLTVERAVAMIRDGFYVGQLIGDHWYVREDEVDGVPAVARGTNSNGRDLNAPGLVVLFYILSGVSLLGGVILAAVFWPSDPGYGREWESVAYAWSVLWLSLGIVEAALFAAVGKALLLLQEIANNTGK